MSLRTEIPGFLDLFEIHRRDPAVFPFLLQSVAGHAQSGRFDILFGFPGERLSGAEGFAAFSRAVSDAGELAPSAQLPFCGGWFVLMGYEAATFIEPRLRLPPSPFGAPDFAAVRCTAAIIHDRERDLLTLVTEGDPEQLRYLRQVVLDAGHAVPLPRRSDRVEDLVEDDPERFLDGVRRILAYLHAGDAFQVNLSRAWRADLKQGVGYGELFQALRKANPAPFAGLALIDGVAILSSSPERLVELDADRVQTRPIAGTRPRGAGLDDAHMQSQLIGNLKERAEHLMLLDLERNDLGRVCRPGSIEVNELMKLETYAHVHHIVSNVRGRLRPGIGPGEVLRAVFPGGTITGCPKLRAMEIIAELEGEGRGPYTGAMGYVSRCGRMDTSILIRSLVVERGRVTLRAGAGIVADSKPEAELAETRAKAHGLLLALGAVP
ncbi:MAG: aminodeoxychorismate synthase component I [Panacagrimonas sp.]